MDQSYLDRIEIILVDTQDGANIGSVCRAMKTMGLTHLTLVTERKYDEDRVSIKAKTAEGLGDIGQGLAVKAEAAILLE